MEKEKVIISVALTGAMTPKDINPNIPLTPEEIAEDAYKCWQAGAAVAHLHMRDKDGIGVMDKELFKKTVDLIKSKCDIVINCTTSGDHRATDDTRMAHIPYVKPEIASFDVGTFNWLPNGVFLNSPEFLTKLGKLMIENEVKPEIEIFDLGMINAAEYFIKKGVIKAPAHFQFVLGVLGASQATVENLVYFKNHIPKDSTWSVTGIGKGHLPMLYTAIALGGHVRVGLEDNVYYSKGRLASNVEFVTRAADLIKLSDKEVATPDEARKILGLRGAK
jgi:3-keto-5-aminohexanoate cleavage enzyme